jgi:hypothetical protein
MKILKPHIISDLTLTSSTVPEPDDGDGTVWSGTAAYTAGAVVYMPATHLRYRAVVDIGAPTTGTNPPPTDASVSPSKWSGLGATNRWRMFDNVVGTATVGESPLKVVLRPGSTSGVAALELVGRSASVVMKDAPGGTEVYRRDIELDGTIIESFFDWFYAEYVGLTDFVLTDLPSQFGTCELTLEVENSGAPAEVGVYKPGLVIDIGETQYGASIGILDFSRKERNAFGDMGVTERAFSKRANFTVITEKIAFNRIFRTLASLRATPCIYIGTEEPGYEPFLIYGFYKDFTIDVPYPTHNLCSIEVEGLT